MYLGIGNIVKKLAGAECERVPNNFKLGLTFFMAPVCFVVLERAITVTGYHAAVFDVDGGLTKTSELEFIVTGVGKDIAQVVFSMAVVHVSFTTMLGERVSNGTSAARFITNGMMKDIAKVVISSEVLHVFLNVAMWGVERPGRRTTWVAFHPPASHGDVFHSTSS